MADDPYARIAQLEAEVAALREREGAAVERAVRAETAQAETLEQQTAKAEVLRVIASAPAELQRVLDALVMSAARLCASDNTNLVRLDHEIIQTYVAYDRSG